MALVNNWNVYRSRAAKTPIKPSKAIDTHMDTRRVVSFKLPSRQTNLSPPTVHWSQNDPLASKILCKIKPAIHVLSNKPRPVLVANSYEDKKDRKTQWNFANKSNPKVIFHNQPRESSALKRSIQIQEKQANFAPQFQTWPSSQCRQLKTDNGVSKWKTINNRAQSPLMPVSKKQKCLPKLLLPITQNNRRPGRPGTPLMQPFNRMPKF